MPGPFQVLANVGDKGTTYEVRRAGDGTIYCSCPSWRFSRERPKSCKHLAAYNKSVLQERGAMAPATWLARAASRVGLLQKLQRTMTGREIAQIERAIDELVGASAPAGTQSTTRAQRAASTTPIRTIILED